MFPNSFIVYCSPLLLKGDVNAFLSDIYEIGFLEAV